MMTMNISPNHKKSNLLLKIKKVKCLVLKMIMQTIHKNMKTTILIKMKRMEVMMMTVRRKKNNQIIIKNHNLQKIKFLSNSNINKINKHKQRFKKKKKLKKNMIKMQAILYHQDLITLFLNMIIISIYINVIFEIFYFFF